MSFPHKSKWKTLVFGNLSCGLWAGNVVFSRAAILVFALVLLLPAYGGRSEENLAEILRYTADLVFRVSV